MQEVWEFLGTTEGNIALGALGFAGSILITTVWGPLPRIRVPVISRPPFRIQDTVVMTWRLIGGTTDKGERYHLYEAHVRLQLVNKVRRSITVPVADLSLSLEGKHLSGRRRVVLHSREDAQPVALESKGAELHTTDRTLTFSSGQLPGPFNTAIFFPVASQTFRGSIRFRLEMASPGSQVLFKGNLLPGSIGLDDDSQA